MPVKEIAIYYDRWECTGRERVRSILSKIRIGIFFLSPSTERSVAQHTARSVYTADYQGGAGFRKRD